MENRKVRETFTLLEDIKKKVEKELKNSESYKQKIILSKVGIFADCLIKCYSPEKEMFLTLLSQHFILFLPNYGGKYCDKFGEKRLFTLSFNLS